MFISLFISLLYNIANIYKPFQIESPGLHILHLINNKS